MAPRQTSTLGLTTSSSATAHGRQAAISLAFGFWWIRRLPRGVHLKCLTAFVRYVSARSIPASASASSSSCPAGPTKGRPTSSSLSPGCSPTSSSRADQILVLEHGRIVQRGTERELMSQGGPFRRLAHQLVEDSLPAA